MSSPVTEFDVPDVQPDAVERAATFEYFGNSDRSNSKTRFPSSFEKLLTAFEFAADLLTIFATLELAYRLSTLFRYSVTFSRFQLFAGMCVLAIVFVLMLDREGAYRRGNGLLRVKDTERILRVSAQLFAVGLLAFYFANIRPFPAAQYLAAAVLVPLALIAEKQIVYIIVRALHLKGVGVSKVVIYGAGQTGRRVFSALTRSPKLGLDPVLMFDDNGEIVGQRVFELAYRRERSVRIAAGPITKEFLVENNISMVVIAVPSLAREKFTGVLNAVTGAGARLAFVPHRHVPPDSLIEHADIDGLLLSKMCGPSDRIFYAFAKRIADVVVALTMLVVLAPLCAIIALLIKLDSKGPVIFVQKRVGRNGELFDLYKFRTMFTQAPAYSYSPRVSDDPRITRFGRFLRRTSLDELPQLVNVLRGTMSLVGPRPEMPFIVNTYKPQHRHRLYVKPGVTGLWQISGDRALLIHENIEYDLYYIRNRNFFMDIAILLHTAVFFMRGI